VIVVRRNKKIHGTMETGAATNGDHGANTPSVDFWTTVLFQGIRDDVYLSSAQTLDVVQRLSFLFRPLVTFLRLVLSRLQFSISGRFTYQEGQICPIG
jgi:hypothetical protein